MYSSFLVKSNDSGHLYIKVLIQSVNHDIAIFMDKNPLSISSYSLNEDNDILVIISLDEAFKAYHIEIVGNYQRFSFLPDFDKIGCFELTIKKIDDNITNLKSAFRRYFVHFNKDVIPKKCVNISHMWWDSKLDKDVKLHIPDSVLYDQETFMNVVNFILK